MGAGAVNVAMMAAGALFTALGYLAGAAVTRRQHRLERPPLPICACTHPLGAHVDGQCQADVRREHYHSSGGFGGHEWVPCACAKYVGPEPLTSFWAPPPILPEVER